MEVPAKALCVVCIVLFSLLLRLSVSSGTYSGHATPPMYGDYEAQRHWMEITVNLPLKEWYHNTTDNDLLYWGLDYPPLTAYVSWCFGKLAEVIEPGLVQLHASRGYESTSSKLFMRWSVVASDLLLFIPVAIYYALNCSSVAVTQLACLLFLLCQPSLILVDHGHFQYNGIMLGLALCAIVCISKGLDKLGGVFFCLSIMFKQMALYYSLAFFAYLLGRAFFGGDRLRHTSRKSFLSSVLSVALMGVTVFVSFGCCLAPFYVEGGIDGVKQVVHRMFPLARGMFEDKVANFWCTSNVVLKWSRYLSKEGAVVPCLVLTVASLLPSMYRLATSPSFPRFLLSLCVSSFSFFLFSFQVHEKSILLVILPVMLLVPWGPLYALAASWMTAIACFSMYPLLHKDGLTVPYIALQILCVGGGHLLSTAWQGNSPTKRFSVLTRVFQISSMGCVIIHILAVALPASSRYPDLVLLLFAVYSFAHFFAFWFVAVVVQWRLPTPREDSHSD